jgi:hypothetical protein
VKNEFINFTVAGKRNLDARRNRSNGDAEKR